MEDQHAVVGQEHRGHPGQDRGPDTRDGLLRPARPVVRHRNPAGQTEHGQRLDPAADGLAGHRVGRGVGRVGVQDAANLRMVGVHGRVHGDHRALDRRQFTFQQRSIQPDPDHRSGRVVTQRRACREVHLRRSGDAQADVPVPVRRDRPAGHDPLGGIDDVVDQVLVHDVPHRGQPVIRTGRLGRILDAQS